MLGKTTVAPFLICRHVQDGIFHTPPDSVENILNFHCWGNKFTTFCALNIFSRFLLATIISYIKRFSYICVSWMGRSMYFHLVTVFVDWEQIELNLMYSHGSQEYLFLTVIQRIPFIVDIPASLLGSEDPHPPLKLPNLRMVIFLKSNCPRSESKRARRHLGSLPRKLLEHFPSSSFFFFSDRRFF